MGAGLLMLILGLVFILGPNVAPIQMPMFGKLAFMGLGAVLAIIGAVMIIITKLYKKASADMAFVRTGMGGLRVVKNGGCLVLPVIHMVTEVMLNTMKLVVNRAGHDALICGDKLRADIEAEFYIRVDPDPEHGITNAAQTLGDKTRDPDAITRLIEQKLVNALRSIAAQTTLQELNTERVKFSLSVLEALRPDLAHNGLLLEGVTISRLDQTPYDDQAPIKNIFDAEGRMTAAQVISEKSIKENEFRRNAEQAIAQKNAETVKVVAEQDFLQNQAKAVLGANTAKAVAEQEKVAEVFKATQHLETEQARLEAAQKIGQRDAERDKNIRLAQVSANQAAQTADVVREQAVAVAGRQKEVAIADAEKQRAAAQAAQLKAEQDREAEKQGVITVEQKATAEREKTVQVIAAQQAAEVRKTEDFMHADIQAYQAGKVAEGQLRAAEQDAEARKIKANAEQEALTAEAAGKTAVANVPINVKAREVEVDSQRVETVDRPSVEVLKSRLAAQDEHTQVSVELEKYRIMWEAIKEAMIAQANAVGQALSSADMKLFGSPEMLGSFTSKFGMGVGLNALLESVLGGDGKTGLGELIAPLVNKLTGAAKEGDDDQAVDVATLLGQLKGLALANPKLKGLVEQVQVILTPASKEATPA